MKNLNLLLTRPWFEPGNWRRIVFALTMAVGVTLQAININNKFAAAADNIHKESRNCMDKCY
jgi:hypothetical protein